MDNKDRIDKSWVTGPGSAPLLRPGSQTPDAIAGTESLVKQGRAGTETLITTAARNGGEDMVEWAERGGEDM